MHNFERRVVGLICILRLICWVVSCGNSLLFHSLTLFYSVLFLLCASSSASLRSAFVFLPSFIAYVLIFFQFFTRLSISMSFFYKCLYFLREPSFTVFYCYLLFYLQFYTFFAIANIEINSFFRIIDIF